MTLDNATYSFPCINGGCLRSTPTYFNDCPCDLLIVIARHSFTGNYFLVSINGISPSCDERMNLGMVSIGASGLCTKRTRNRY